MSERSRRKRSREQSEKTSRFSPQTTLLDFDALAEIEVTCTINLNGTEHKIPLDAREFTTGSLEFHANPKISYDKSNRFQTNLMLILIGSKNR